MTDQDRYIPGVPCWIDTTQPDLDAAAAFYSALFGWEIEDVMPPGAPVRYLIGRRGGGDVAGIGEPPGAALWNTYIWVEDAAETASKVRAAGGTVLVEPRDVGEDGRTAVLADPAGAVFRVWQPGLHRGATVVNEHGALNFNVLTTPDLDAAQAFYGAVFGWELLDIGGASMWALASYGDFLERRTPGLRENMAQMGAPERFADVVASINPAGGDARWDVTFGADDADAIAARATELGGTVIVPPTDAPWTRMTVIADPAGATFTASQFVIENKDLAQEAATSA
jgi:predicted enzyme related to lactoylglutathione lyase